MNTCGRCQSPKKSTIRTIGGSAAQWSIPGLILCFVPKCPACIAAYCMLWTGLGISFATASILRHSMIGISLALIVFLSLRLGFRVCNRLQLHLGNPRS